MSEPTGTQYGGFWIRFLALLTDCAIVFVLSSALLIGASMALGPGDMTPVMIAVWVVGFLYWPVLHASRLRGTFGKALLGLHLTRFDGRRISIFRALWREIAKVFSGAVFMLGYVITAFMPRKQALHDLMAATYVVREGVSRVFPALLVVLAGYATPVFVAPMLVQPAVMSTIEKMASDAMAQYDPLKQAAHPVPPAVKVAPRPAAPIAKAPTPPKIDPPKTEAPAPKPTPVALAQPAPAPVAEPAKPITEPVKPTTEAAKALPEPSKTVAEPAKTVPKTAPKPKAAVAKQKHAPAVSTVRVANPSPATSDFMFGTGLKYNDLMTAVVARDAAAVNELLRLGKWVDKPDSSGRTPLMVATAQNDVPTAEALLRGGASPRPAVRVAEERGNGEMVALLKRYGGR
ncbi:MAG TPA: RDD family protein [Burkholderiales bacterium]|jgi:uncharacterized RDD family membrane protein YckC